MGRCHRSVVPVPSSEVVLATALALASPGSGEESREEAEEGRDTWSCRDLDFFEDVSRDSDVDSYDSSIFLKRSSGG